MCTPPGVEACRSVTRDHRLRAEAYKQRLKKKGGQLRRLGNESFSGNYGSYVAKWQEVARGTKNSLPFLCLPFKCWQIWNALLHELEQSAAMV